jgi:hypothetical protein
MTTKVTSLVLSNTTVASGNYGGLTQIPSLNIDAQGRVTFAANNAVSSISISSGQVTGLASSATTDTTNASNITSGTLGSARLTGTYSISVSGNAGTVTNGVYTTGDQTIGGTKTFSSTITGSITGNAGTATSATSATNVVSGGTIASNVTGTTQSVGTNNTTIATTAFVRSIVPAGVILMWSGSIASIPSGWLICDGNNSTPDLRNRFIVGAGSTYAVGATGGSADAIVVSHTHTASSSTASLTGNVYGISESFRSGGGAADGVFTKGGSYNVNLTPVGNDPGDGGQFSMDASHSHTISVSSTGSPGTNANLPPYYALAYIMKS